MDEAPHYAAIHGVRSELGAAEHAVYDHCLPRLAEWMSAESIPATIFAIGQDLERADNRAAIARLHAAGHEVGNHSYHHYYDLTRRSVEEIRDEVERAAERIADACGTRPRGFRAPGYTVTDELLDILRDAGVAYDSSVFPCPSYYAAKAGALSAMRARGRRSASILDTPAVLRAPRQPYRVGRPYWKHGKGLLELPIGVTRWQLPFIGTSLVLGGRRAARALSRQMLGRPFINLELHGFDVADAEEDGLGALTPHRADLRRSAEQKLQMLDEAVRVVRRAGYQLVTLEEAASRFSRSPSP